MRTRGLQPSLQLCMEGRTVMEDAEEVCTDYVYPLDKSIANK